MKKDELLISRSQAIDKIILLRSQNKFGKKNKQWSLQQIFEGELKESLVIKNNHDLNVAFHKAFPELHQFIQPDLFKQ